MNATGETWSKSHYGDIIKYGWLLVAEHNDKVIGYICGEPLVHSGSMLWYHIVDKKFRGHGVGTMLLDYFEQVLKESGIEWFVAYTSKKKVTEMHQKRGAVVGEVYTEIVKDF